MSFNACRPQGLAEPPRVLGDQPARRAEDVRGRAVILFEADDRRAGEVLVEAEYVRHLRPAPRIDRLIVVADAGDIAPLLREQPQPQILRDVGVLILIDEDVFEAPLIVRQHVGVAEKDRQHVKQQVAEIGGVQGLQALLISRIQCDRLVLVPALFACRDLRRGPAAVLPPVDQRCQPLRRPALLVDVSLGEHLLEQPQLVVGVEDREVAFEPDQSGVPPQHPRRDRMEGAEELHALRGAAEEQRHPVLHLARRLVGEGNREDLRRPRPPGEDDVRKAAGQRARLARPRAREEQHRAFGGEHGLALGRVEPVHVRRLAGRGRGGAHRLNT
jgi:hypothetical protein